VLVLATIVILVDGALRREVDREAEAPPGTAIATPSAEPFRPDLEKGPLTYLSDYWLQVAEGARQAFVPLGGGATGVCVGDGLALGTLEAADVLAAAADPASPARSVAADAGQGLALFELGEKTEARPLRAAEGVRTGAWLAAVTMDSERGLQVVPGFLVSTRPAARGGLDVAMAFPSSVAIAVVVDLDGRLAGIAVRLHDRVRVFVVQDLDALVARLAANPVCRGLQVVSAGPKVLAALGLEAGVVVEAIEADAFPTPPDLRPGDVLLRWNGRRLAAPDDFAPAYDATEPGTPVRFVALRGRRRLDGRLEMPGRDGRPYGMRPRAAARLGAVAQWLPADRGETGAAGVRLLRVLEGGPAAEAGLAGGDILLSSDGAPLDWAAARRLLESPAARARPSIITFYRNGAVRLAALPAGRAR
jgi:S1-C subfamily serine protease